MSAHRGWVVVGVLALLGAATRLFHGFEWDELQLLHGAWRIGHGAVPYRDFFEHHPPLLHVLLAPLAARKTEISWPLLIELRSVAAVVLTGVLVGLGWLLGRGAPPAAIPITGVAMLVLGARAGKLFELRADWVALIALLGGMQLRLRMSPVFAGLLAGTAICLTQKALPVWAGMVAWGFLASHSPEARGRLRSAAAFVGASFALPSAMLAWFWWHGALSPMFASIVTVNMGWPREVAWQTTWAASAVAALGALALMVAALVAALMRRTAEPETSLVAAIAVFGAAAYVWTPVPWEQSYLFLVVPWMSLLAVERLATYAERPAEWTVDRPVLAAALLVGALSLPASLAVRATIVALIAGAAISLALQMDDRERRFRRAVIALLLPGTLLFASDRLADVAGERGTAQLAFARALTAVAPADTPVLALWDHVLPFRPAPAFHWFAHAGMVERFRDGRGGTSLDAEYADIVRQDRAALVIADEATMDELRQFANAVHQRCVHVTEGYAGSDAYACGVRRAMPSHRAAPGRAAARAPNILLVVVDTLRADHVSAYGYHRATTPVLDTLAASGALFEQAISQAPWTAASVASLLTGLSPAVHGIDGGVRWTGDGASGALPFVTQRVLRTSVTTLAESLRADGYATAAFVSNVYLHNVFGFARGFDVYVDDHDDYAVDVMTRKRRAEETNRRVTHWLDSDINEPFFLLVHYNDPHWPYDPPPPFGAEWTRGYLGTLSPERSAVVVENEGQPARGLSPSDARYLEGLYDGEIRYADVHLGHLLDHLRSMRTTRPILTVVTADHGEEFLEHGSTSHGYTLYEEQVRVPLVMHFPGHIAPSRVPAQVRLIDVMPTIRALAGLRPLRRLQGRSLLPMLQSGGSGTGRAAVSEAPLRGVMRSLRTSEGRKLIVRPARGTSELYDLRTDPGEHNDRASDDSSVRKALDRQLSARVASSGRMLSRRPAEVDRPVVVDEALQQRLRALGYVADRPEPARP